MKDYILNERGEVTFNSTCDICGRKTNNIAQTGGCIYECQSCGKYFLNIFNGISWFDENGNLSGRMKNNYSVGEIRSVFWKFFHKSGEQYFDYSGSDLENEQSTAVKWKEFLCEFKNI